MTSRGHVVVQGFPGEHRVTEDLGYSHDRCCYAKAVSVQGEERIVVAPRRSGPWRINRPVVDVSGIARQMAERNGG